MLIVIFDFYFVVYFLLFNLFLLFYMLYFYLLLGLMLVLKEISNKKSFNLLVWKCLRGCCLDIYLCCFFDDCDLWIDLVGIEFDYVFFLFVLL